MKLTLTIFTFLLISNTFAQEPIGIAQTIVEKKISGCISGNCIDGWGNYQYDSGSYEGFWVNGEKNGYGVYNWSDEGTYVGFWKNNNMEGYGVYRSKNGVILRGMYIQGKLNGLGEFYKEKAKLGAGLYKDNVLQIEYDFLENFRETGCISGNCVDKFGEYVWDNGDEFIGFFKGGNPVLGDYQFSSGNIYQGMFNASGQFNGQGVFLYSGGGYYAGEFSNGLFNGKGYYHDKEYKTQIGIWENGKLVKSLQ